MVRKVVLGIGLFLVTMATSPGHADVFRFDFTGTVTNSFNNGLPDPLDIFGLSVNENDLVSGFFFIDTAAPVAGSANGSVAGSGTAYTQSSPPGVQINLGGGVFTSDGVYNSAIVNDFDDGSGAPPFEQFAVNDGANPPDSGFSGDTILLDGGTETARLALEFTDTQATVFNSTALPTSLDLSEFEIASGTIQGQRPSGQANPFFYSTEFSIDSITVTSIPEPSSIAILACFGAAALNRRRRSSYR